MFSEDIWESVTCRVWGKAVTQQALFGAADERQGPQAFLQQRREGSQCLGTPSPTHRREVSWGCWPKLGTRKSVIMQMKIAFKRCEIYKSDWRKASLKEDFKIRGPWWAEGRGPPRSLSSGPDEWVQNPALAPYQEVIAKACGPHKP